MKITKLIFAILLSIVITSCGGGTSPSTTLTTTPTTTPLQATITVQNVGDANGLVVNHHQFTSLTLTPTDNSSSATTYSFVASVGETKTVKVNLPKTGSYKIVVYADNSAKNIQWNSVAMSTANTTAIYLVCINHTYTLQSLAAGLSPTSCTLNGY